MALIQTKMEIPGYEQVVWGENAEAGLRSFIAIHSTKRGPACGGFG